MKLIGEKNRFLRDTSSGMYFIHNVIIGVGRGFNNPQYESLNIRKCLIATEIERLNVDPF